MNGYQTIVNKPEVFDETNMVVTHLLNGASRDQNVNGSITPAVFSYTPPEGKNFICKRIMLYMEDATAFSSEKFAGITALTNGWEMHINDVAVMNVKDNADFAVLMYDVNGVPSLGKETLTMLGRFTLANLTRSGEGVTIGNGKSIDVTVQDDLSGLDRLHVVVEGFLENAF